MNRLTEIANKYGTDKGTVSFDSHGFTEFYESFIKDLKNPVILELGVEDGFSLLMWNDYFDGNCTIYGVDIEDKSYLELPENIHIIQCDCGKRENLQKLKNDLNTDFDIIVDDASHKWEHQFLSLATFCESVKPEGVFIVEDLHTSYMEDFGEGNTKNNSPLHYLNFFEKPVFLTEEEHKMLEKRIDQVYLRNVYNECVGGVSCSITSVIKMYNGKI